VNKAIGVSPYIYVYGFTTKGPLSIVKDNWAGLVELPPKFGKSTTEYMQSLTENL